MTLQQALNEALDDEYKARATYAAVLERFGEVFPFVNIIESEERHIGALLRQFRRLGLTPPVDRWSGAVQAPTTVEQACREAAAAERENDALYERLLAGVDDPGVRETMARLREASRERHLPAFERCVARESGRAGDGCGGGRGRGRGRCGT